MVSKKAISVTLDADNLTWLKGRARATGVRSVSELLDRIVGHARAAAPGGTVRSVIGTVDIDPRDPLLEHADAAVRAAFDASLQRPLLVKERSPAFGATRRPGRKRRG